MLAGGVPCQPTHAHVIANGRHLKFHTGETRCIFLPRKPLKPDHRLEQFKSENKDLHRVSIMLL